MMSFENCQAKVLNLIENKYTLGISSKRVYHPQEFAERNIENPLQECLV